MTRATIFAKPWLAFTILTTFTVPAWPEAPAKPAKPAVVGISGEWTLDAAPSQPAERAVHFGRELTQGATVRGGHKGDHIVFSCPDGQLLSRGCPADGCPVQACGKETGEKANPRPAWLTSTLALVSRNPDRFITAVSRGLGPEPWEAVLEGRANGLDVAPLLSRLPAGVYRLKLSHLPEKPAFVAEREVKWTPGNSAIFAAPAVRPAVYRVVIVDGPGDTQGSQAWALVASSAAAPALLRRWEQVSASVAPWREEVEPVYLHAFLRATLVALLEGASAQTAGR